MATSSYHQPLLNPPKSTHKILFFFLSITTLLSLAYIGNLLITQNQTNPTNNNLTSLCDKSHDTSSCLALITEVTNVYDESNGQDLLGKIMASHVSDINKAIKAAQGMNSYTGVVADCIELMDLSRDRLGDSIKALAKSNADDINSWLSAVLTNYVTCLDQLQEYYPHDNNGLKSMVEGLISKGRAILAIQANLYEPSYPKDNVLKTTTSMRTMYPSWVRRSDRKLLEATGTEISPDLVVSKDGTGNFTTVGEAVAAAPDKGKKRFVIYVKEGVYEENVEVGKKKKNLMIVGDGMNKTVITGSLNVVDGTTTFRSATLAAVGDGFILQDICIQNTAGPEKHQAVALRVGADQSVMNRCKIDAYQDTLYAHSLRQFYRDCYISGTVDFIFGNAAVVLQKCQLVPRKPMQAQQNMVTAQGRTDPNQNTGTSIQYCDIVASPDLAPVEAQFPTFLGRPWKEYSRTVVMQSNLGSLINPKGWAKWDGDFALDTLYYGEYKNTGPGSDTSQRVNWTGYHIITDPKIAKQFTVGEFIQGQEWLDSSLVTYDDGL